MLVYAKSKKGIHFTSEKYLRTLIFNVKITIDLNFNNFNSLSIADIADILFRVSKIIKTEFMCYD